VTLTGPISTCQVCSSPELSSVLFLGYLPPVNLLRPLSKPHPAEPWFPTELLQCQRCHLVQLSYIADPTVIFPPEYPYRSGTTRVLRENFADLAREVIECLPLSPGTFVVDIGSNDGTLLQNFHERGFRILGVEPSLTATIAQEQGIPTLMTFFNTAAVDEVLRDHGQAQLITAANVFAHIPGIHGIVEEILRLLAPGGVFVSESHYLLDLLRTLQYDTIYHEHLRYYSLHSLKHLLESHGLSIFSVKRIPTHGGSIRVYASASRDYTVDDSVPALLEEEKQAGLLSKRWIQPFRERVLHSKLALYELLAQLKRAGSVIYGIGAPSRASTLLHYVGLQSDILECILEVQGSLKLDKYMPGTNIPVLEESKLSRDQPPYVLLLSWHIAPELQRNLKKRGYQGDFIVPLPEPRIVRNHEISVA
jgi:SAM-dependent methyltransferase